MSLLTRHFASPVGDIADYPISAEARRRIGAAHLRDVTFEMKRILRDGGYTSDEIEAIVAVLAPFVAQYRSPSFRDVFDGLRARGFGEDDADIIARAFGKA